VTQKVQNVELTNPTQTLATARAETMIQLEERVRAYGGQGVVEVSSSSGPVRFATHVQSFTAWGTVVASASIGGQRHPSPRMTVSMNDLDQGFEASALRAKPKASPKSNAPSAGPSGTGGWDFGTAHARESPG
jgi:hypothetical protein